MPTSSRRCEESGWLDQIEGPVERRLTVQTKLCSDLIRSTGVLNDNERRHPPDEHPHTARDTQRLWRILLHPDRFARGVRTICQTRLVVRCPAPRSRLRVLYRRSGKSHPPTPPSLLAKERFFSMRFDMQNLPLHILLHNKNNARPIRTGPPARECASRRPDNVPRPRGERKQFPLCEVRSSRTKRKAGQWPKEQRRGPTYCGAGWA